VRLWADLAAASEHPAKMWLFLLPRDSSFRSADADRFLLKQCRSFDRCSRAWGQGYGPSIAPTSFGQRVHDANQENIREYDRVIDFVADWFAGSDVRYLEKIATAYFVTIKNPRIPAVERARRLNSLKPHVDIFAAEEAVQIVDAKRQEAQKQFKEIAA